MKDDSVRTYQTRVIIGEADEAALQLCAKLLAHVEHALFADICKGKDPGELKSAYLTQYNITARQFNAIRINVEGKIASIKELRKIRICELKERIKVLEVKIPKLKKKPLLAHRKKRRLHTLQQRLENLVKAQGQGTISLCFGSKQLFHAQFNLEANGYKSHEEWLDDFRLARTSELFFLGSKDETSGNQTCTAFMEQNGTLTLRVRMPDALCSKTGKYLTLSNITFAYGHEHVLAALADCEQRHLLAKDSNSDYINHGQALTYRFKQDKKGWCLFVSLSLPIPKWKSNKAAGVIGVDINTDHLAFVETDRFGNPIHKQTVPLNLYGKTQEQSQALIGDACAQVVLHAEKTLKPLVLENLDFQKKKQSLREMGASLSRKLSSFAYQSILIHLKSRAFRKCIEVKHVNPAFTSLIGRVKFAVRYGLSLHHAAALCIGRRFLNFSEKVPRHLDNIPDGKDAHVALSLPVRNRDKHVWHLWRGLSRKLTVALAAHFRAKRSSSTLKAALATAPLPDLVGAIPTCEPSASLFG